MSSEVSFLLLEEGWKKAQGTHHQALLHLKAVIRGPVDLVGTQLLYISYDGLRVRLKQHPPDGGRPYGTSKQALKVSWTSYAMSPCRLCLISHSEEERNASHLQD